MSAEDINKEEYDICVKCGKTTSHKKTDNIVFFYIYFSTHL